MSNIKAIRTEADYDAALSRIDALMDAEPGTPAGDELDVLVDLVEHYEERREPIGFPSAIAAIRFRMEQANLTPRTWHRSSVAGQKCPRCSLANDR